MHPFLRFYHLLLFFTQIKCDACDRWYHLKCVVKHSGTILSIEQAKNIHFQGPCCSVSGNYVLCE